MLVQVNALPFDGLVTLERARMLTGRLAPADLSHWELDEAAKVTVYVGRHERVDGKPAHEAVVAFFHRRGVAGATVLLGVDGTAHGERQRAKFFGANAVVPLVVIAVGEMQRLAQLLAELGTLLPRPLITLERVRVCKRDGNTLAQPRHLPETDSSGLQVWQKPMVYASEQARTAGHPLHHHLIRTLRRAGASGATSLRGIWGYHGDHRPHGDSVWQLRRRVPIVTVIVDTPERTRRWFDPVDELTHETGLVTSEMVPAFRATGPAVTRGGLKLARLTDQAERPSWQVLMGPRRTLRRGGDRPAGDSRRDG